MRQRRRRGDAAIIVRAVFQSGEDGNGWAFPKRYQSEVLSENQLVRQDVFSRGEVWSDCSSLPSGNLAPGSHVSALHGQWPGKARVVKDTVNCHIYLFERLKSYHNATCLFGHLLHPCHVFLWRVSHCTFMPFTKPSYTNRCGNKQPIILWAHTIIK